MGYNGWIITCDSWRTPASAVVRRLRLSGDQMQLLWSEQEDGSWKARHFSLHDPFPHIPYNLHVRKSLGTSTWHWEVRRNGIVLVEGIVEDLPAARQIAHMNLARKTIPVLTSVA
jgi:hypothetical protein